MADLHAKVTLNGLIESLIDFLGIASGMGLAIPLVRQIIGYLRSGDWTPYSTLDALALFSDSPWLRSPDSWFGVHRALDFIHGGFFLMVTIGLAGLAVIAALALFAEPRRAAGSM